MDDKKWPEDYPDDIEVPPEYAIEINGDFFRLVHKSQPDADDFLASYKDPKQRHLIKYDRFKKSPGFYGTSFFDSHDSASALVAGNPERFSGQKIASGSLKPEHGLGTIPNGTGHFSFWFYDGVYPLGFEVV